MSGSHETQESWTKNEIKIREVSLSPETAPSQVLTSSIQIQNTEKVHDLSIQETRVPSTPYIIQSPPFHPNYPNIPSQSLTLETNLRLRNLGWLFK